MMRRLLALCQLRLNATDPVRSRFTPIGQVRGTARCKSEPDMNDRRMPHAQPGGSQR